MQTSWLSASHVDLPRSVLTLINISHSPLSYTISGNGSRRTSPMSASPNSSGRPAAGRLAPPTSTPTPRVDPKGRPEGSIGRPFFGPTWRPPSERPYAGRTASTKTLLDKERRRCGGAARRRALRCFFWNKLRKRLRTSCALRVGADFKRNYSKFKRRHFLSPLFYFGYILHFITLLEVYNRIR